MFGTNKAFVVVVDDVLCFPEKVRPCLRKYWELQ